MVLQLRKRLVISNVHLFVAGALLVVAIGGTMGVLVGLQLATGTGVSDVGAHAPVMLFYILLLVSAIVEWTVQSSLDAEWSRPGLGQALAAVVGGLVPAIAIPFGLEPLMPIMLLGLLVFFLLFLGRVGWTALSSGPLGAGIPAWTFFGTAWLVPVVLVFPAEIAIDPPAWFFPVVAHMAFLGMTSNVLFGLVSERTRESRRLHPWAEPGAKWLLNLGILTFVVVEIAVDARHGAFVMGLGALLGVSAMLYRLLE